MSWTSLIPVDLNEICTRRASYITTQDYTFKIFHTKYYYDNRNGNQSAVRFDCPNNGVENSENLAKCGDAVSRLSGHTAGYGF